MEKHLEFFNGLFGQENVLTDSSALEIYSKDRTKQFPSSASCIVFPNRVEQLSQFLAYCNENQILVQSSGGRTGLSGAAVAENRSVVVSMTKMNRIIHFDPISLCVEVEAGVILEDLQKFVDECGFYFPLDFAAKGSATIGGCISTNAGGIKVIRYGMTRDLVLGLEVVLMNGQILDCNRKLIKDNSGYALQQLFISAEGTLGIISKATLKCVAKSKNLYLSCFAINKFQFIARIIERIRKESITISALEFFSDLAMSKVLYHQTHLRQPFDDRYPYYLLCEIESDNRSEMEALMENLADASLIENAVISTSSKEFNDLWALRESISESISLTAPVHKNDISIPVKYLNQFIPELEVLVKSHYSDYQLILFGHIGDGNIHVNVLNHMNKQEELFRLDCKRLDEEMFKLIAKYKGSISAEHGIGLLKKDLLLLQKSSKEIQLMKDVKRIFDPKNLLNRSKIFDIQ